MQLNWLIQQHHRTCLLFFSGWAMFPAPFAELDWGKRDVLFIHDYQAIEPIDLQKLANHYQHLECCAWSMGVSVAFHLLSGKQHLFRRSIAVGGTLAGIDDQTGIPQQAFLDAINRVSPEWQQDFYRSMFENQQEADRFLRHRPWPPVTTIRNELARLYHHVCTSHRSATYGFDYSFVLSRDRIIPARNQRRCWKSYPRTLLPAPHFPFYQFSPAALLMQPETHSITPTV